MRYLLISGIRDIAAAGSFLATQIPGVESVAGGPGENIGMSIAITYPGLIKFFGDEAPIRFDLAFREGMSNARRARILGDEGNNHKSGWDWGGDNEIDLMLILFSKQDVDQRLAQLTPAIEAFATLTVLTGELPDDRKEPFGFRDGISQPVIEGTWVTRRALRSEAR